MDGHIIKYGNYNFYIGEEGIFIELPNNIEAEITERLFEEYLVDYSEMRQDYIASAFPRWLEGRKHNQ